MADKGWQRKFEDPLLPEGRKLVTLRDATDCITGLPKKETALPEWQAAIEALILVGEQNGPTMFARIGVMQALNRGHVREFNPTRPALGPEEAQESNNPVSESAPPEKNGMPDGPISRGFGSWPSLRAGSAGKVCLSVHQRTDAASLHQSGRTSSAKLSYDRVPDDRTNNCANPTAPAAAARNLGVFATGRRVCR
ncbi:hypothetical protein ACF1BQ_035490 [Bradyrhizobium sp. RDT10]